MHFVLPQFYLAFQCIVHFSKWLLLLLSVQVVRNRHSVGRLRDTTSSSHTSVITCNFKRILGFTTNCKSYYVLKSCQQARYNSGPTKNWIRVIGKHLTNNFIHMPIGWSGAFLASNQKVRNSNILSEFSEIYLVSKDPTKREKF